MNLTSWFDGNVKPVRPGVYERDYSRGGHVGPFYSEWTGCQWLVPAMSPKAASKQVVAALGQRTRPWRGLAKDPKS